MHKFFHYFVLIVLLILGSCTRQESRKMWQPSHTYIGIEPNDDAPVKSGTEASSNFAQDKTLTIEDGVSMAYLKFFMPGFSEVDSAILRVQTKDVISPGTVSVYEVLDKNWDETQITWDKRPSIRSEEILSMKFEEPQKVYELDFTDFVKEKLTKEDFYICLCFKTNDEKAKLSFASVEDYDNLKPRFMVGGLTYVPPAPPAYAPTTFKHPGILVTTDQINFVKEKVHSGQSPWKEALDAATKNEFAQVEYKPSPFDTLTFSGRYRRSVSRGHIELNKDANAAFFNAELWTLTDSARYAEKTIEIINAWAETNKAITGGNDKLTGGTTCIQLCNAAEILKHTYPGWKQEDQQIFEDWLRTVYWPLLRDFIPSYNGNWDAIIGQGLLSMGIYLDDKFIFDHAVNYYLNGIGNGKMTYYVREDSTSQETLRDQGHEQMGIGALAGFAETALNQGIDLYSIENNRLLKGIEGTAKRVFETDYRRLEIWESMYNHYHNRMGHNMPYTEKILNAPEYRPEGYGGYRGLSTLFFYGLGNR